MSGAASKPIDGDGISLMVDEFIGITSATREEAIFFLESHNWVVDSAVQSFYDDPPIQTEQIAQQDEYDAGVENDGEEEEEQEAEEREADSEDEDYLPSEIEDDTEKEKTAKKSGIKTISDLKRKADSDSDSDSGSDSDGQEFFTGGEKSGMVVRDPSKRRKPNINAQAILDQARKMADKPGPSKNSKSFKGKGRTLAGEETPSEQNENPSYNIFLWRNGFTVNNGPLRSFNDPQNASFMESIKKSECPAELRPSDGSSEVGVNIIRKQSNYPIPVPKKRGKQNGAFRGKGRTIGEGPSEDTPTQVPDPAPILSSTNSPRAQLEPSSATNPPVILEDSSPTTSLQIRLTDGTRLVSRFNTSSTIGDVRAFIDASRPGVTGIVYQLQTVGFPPKRLDDVSKTIEEEGIGNSVVIQKLA